MKRLLIIPIFFLSCMLVQAQTKEESKKKEIPKPESFADKIVEIDPIIPGEKKVLWKLEADGHATNLYEKKKTHWKIKDNMLYIGKKRYHLAENAFLFVE